VIISMRPKTHKELDVWQAGVHLTIVVYQTTRSFPTEERFGLVSQMRRAALSIPSNVAEGHAFRFQRRAYLRHVRIALGSFAELETQLEVVARLRLVDTSVLESLAAPMTRSGQLLHGLLRSLRKAGEGAADQ
jgi:four helix bundle protein